MSNFKSSELPNEELRNLILSSGNINENDNENTDFQNVIRQREKRKRKEEDAFQNLCRKVHEVIERQFFTNQIFHHCIFCNRIAPRF